MGLDTSFYVGAKAHIRPTVEQIEALITDLRTRDFVKMPCALLVGKEMRLDVPPSSLISSLSGQNKDFFHERTLWPVKYQYAPDYYFEEENEQPEDVLIYYAGQSEQALLASLRGLDSETKDICICFSGLTFDDGKTWEGYEVYIFSLTQPRPLVCANAYGAPEYGEKHDLQYVINISGRYGIWELDGTPLEPILIEHLGPDLIIDCTFA